MHHDNIEIDVDGLLRAPELNELGNVEHKSLVRLSIKIIGGKLITVGTHFRILTDIPEIE